MDQQTVDRLRERLESERGEIRRQLDDLGARRDAEGIENPDLNEGFADAGQAAAERASLLTLVRSLRDTLRDVEQALERMAAGTYGTCDNCGQPIADERLDALPAARLCLNCKRQRGRA
jgi:DnaK suppressor protein